MPRSSSTAARATALAVALAVAVSGGACGDGDRDGATGEPTGARKPPGKAGTSGDGAGGGGAAVGATVERMYRDLANGDAAAVCTAMTAAAQAQIAQQVLGGSTEPPEDRTCRASLARFLDAAGPTGALEQVRAATVERVAIRGRTATATVSFGAASGDVRLRRERGRWRVEATALEPRR